MNSDGMNRGRETSPNEVIARAIALTRRLVSESCAFDASPVSTKLVNKNDALDRASKSARACWTI
jgi:hypothetical protein